MQKKAGQCPPSCFCTLHQPRCDQNWRNGRIVIPPVWACPLAASSSWPSPTKLQICRKGLRNKRKSWL